MNNHADALIIHTAICFGAKQNRIRHEILYELSRAVSRKKRSKWRISVENKNINDKKKFFFHLYLIFTIVPLTGLDHTISVFF